MVVVEFDYGEMKRLVDLPRDKMVAMLSELGAPSEYEPEVDKVITELTPNRPDWYSMEGLARALKAFLGKERPRYKTKKSDYKVIVDPTVAAVRPYTVCAVVKGLKFNDERIRDAVLLQEKLLATLGRRVKKFGLGIYPLHAIRFPVSYTTMKPGDIRYVPLGHEEEMGADDILKMHKKGQQYGQLLKGHKRYPVFVDASGKVMALIPIVNSAETGKVDSDTRDIFIEVSGIEMQSCKAALNILACTFADMGGEVFEVAMDYGGEKFRSPDLSEKIMALDIGKVNSILGLTLTEKQVAGHLARMGYGYSGGKAAIPPYRADILGIVDIIEDIAISYGYNNFRPTVPDFFFPGRTITKYDGTDAIMRGMGFLEAKTFILTNKERLDMIGMGRDVVEIANPGTADYTVVRPTLILDMLETFRINKMKGVPQKFYEIGIVRDGKQSEKRLAFGMMDKKIEFADARGVLQALAAEKGLYFTLEKKPLKAFDPEISCAVMANGNEIGVFGKVSGSLLERLGLDFEVYICELSL
ncbi:phenylalanine--tRNA ligase subunit beta [Candidatus Micrarchaeota archaeon]|nr:phenylalanine--tRNA ligase subunit beta [Candidatus Micrarchaeota archaeon]